MKGCVGLVGRPTADGLSTKVVTRQLQVKRRTGKFAGNNRRSSTVLRNYLVAREKSGFQTLSKGLIVLQCAEVVQQRVPDHGALHSECSAANNG